MNSTILPHCRRSSSVQGRSFMSSPLISVIMPPPSPKVPEHFTN